MAKLRKLKFGTWAKYNALSEKDENTLYFITDRKSIYRGSEKFSDVVSAVASGSGETAKRTFTICNQGGQEVSFDVPTSAALAAVKSVLEAALADHADDIGSNQVYGHLKLSDSISSNLSTNGGVAATPKAVKDALDTAKAYADGLSAGNDAMIFKGTIGASSDNPTVTSLPTTYSTGWTYKVVTAGTYAGKPCEIGDMIIAINDASALQSTVNADWAVVQANIDGAVTAGNTLALNTIILGGGSRTLKSLANGSQGQFLVIGKDQNSNLIPMWVTLSVNVSQISGVLPITQGGTGASTAAQARTNLGLGDAATHDVASEVTQGSSDLPTGGAVYTAINAAVLNAAPDWEELT